MSVTISNQGEMVCPPGRVRAEFDVQAWRQNFRSMARAVAPAGIIPVLKANAYGLGALEAGRSFVAEGACYLAVSCLREALELRELNCPILILGIPLPYEISCIIQNGITASIPDLETAQALSQAAGILGKPCTVHLKIDTGMGRLGIQLPGARELIRKIVQLPNLIVEGIYSHFAVAGTHDQQTLGQYEALRDLIVELEQDGIQFRYRHIANSTATAGLPMARQLPFNMVRSGLDLHGAHLSITPRPYQTNSVVTLKTYLATIRHMPFGATIGYGRTYRVTRPEGERIGVVSIGYADGYPRSLSNCGGMLVRGRLCPIVGLVCMDYTMLSLAETPDAKPGDEVVVIGNQGEAEMSLAEVARTAKTIPYNIICAIGSRVERHYLNLEHGDV
jgi:alanine racemase